jgi:hypothetical protein
MFNFILGVVAGGAAVWFAKPTLQTWYANIKAKTV